MQNIETGINCPYADKRNKQSIASSIGLAIILLVVILILKLQGLAKETIPLIAICGQGGLFIWAWSAWATEKKHGRAEAFRQGRQMGESEGKDQGIRESRVASKETFYGQSRRGAYGLVYKEFYPVRLLVRKRNKVYVLLTVRRVDLWHEFDINHFDDSLGDIEYHLVTSLGLTPIRRDEFTVTVFQDPPTVPTKPAVVLEIKATTPPKKETARINIPDDLLKVGLQDPPNEEE